MAMTKEAAQELTEKSIQDLLDSPEQWLAWAKTYSKFHSYSPGNILMIHGQFPEATKVAGFHAWKELGRSVKKGESGIAILAPMVVRDKRETTPSEDEKRIAGFRVAYVFDIAQTEGKDLDLPRFQTLKGEDFEQAWAELVKASPVPVEVKELFSPGLLGYYAPQAGMITIRLDQSSDQKLATLVHELGHYAGHPPGQTLQVEHRHAEEIIAELAGYVLAEKLGLDVGEQSLAYTCHHALGSREAVLSTMAEVGKRVGELMPIIETVKENLQVKDQQMDPFDLTPNSLPPRQRIPPAQTENHSVLIDMSKAHELSIHASRQGQKIQLTAVESRKPNLEAPGQIDFYLTELRGETVKIGEALEYAGTREALETPFQVAGPDLDEVAQALGKKLRQPVYTPASRDAEAAQRRAENEVRVAERAAQSKQDRENEHDQGYER